MIQKIPIAIISILLLSAFNCHAVDIAPFTPDSVKTASGVQLKIELKRFEQRLFIDGNETRIKGDQLYFVKNYQYDDKNIVLVSKNDNGSSNTTKRIYCIFINADGSVKVVPEDGFQITVENTIIPKFAEPSMIVKDNKPDGSTDILTFNLNNETVQIAHLKPKVKNKTDQPGNKPIDFEKLNSTGLMDYVTMNRFANNPNLSDVQRDEALKKFVKQNLVWSGVVVNVERGVSGNYDACMFVDDGGNSNITGNQDLVLEVSKDDALQLRKDYIYVFSADVSGYTIHKESSGSGERISVRLTHAKFFGN